MEKERCKLERDPGVINLNLLIRPKQLRFSKSVFFRDRDTISKIVVNISFLGQKLFSYCILFARIKGRYLG